MQAFNKFASGYSPIYSRHGLLFYLYSLKGKTIQKQNGQSTTLTDANSLRSADIVSIEGVTQSVKAHMRNPRIVALFHLGFCGNKHAGHLLFKDIDPTEFEEYLATQDPATCFIRNQPRRKVQAPQKPIPTCTPDAMRSTARLQSTSIVDTTPFVLPHRDASFIAGDTSLTPLVGVAALALTSLDTNMLVPYFNVVAKANPEARFHNLTQVLVWVFGLEGKHVVDRHGQRFVLRNITDLKSTTSVTIGGVTQTVHRHLADPRIATLLGTGTKRAEVDAEEGNDELRLCQVDQVVFHGYLAELASTTSAKRKFTVTTSSTTAAEQSLPVPGQPPAKVTALEERSSASPQTTRAANRPATVGVTPTPTSTPELQPVPTSISKVTPEPVANDVAMTPAGGKSPTTLPTTPLEATPALLPMLLEPDEAVSYPMPALPLVSAGGLLPVPNVFGGIDDSHYEKASISSAHTQRDSALTCCRKDVLTAILSIQEGKVEEVAVQLLLWTVCKETFTPNGFLNLKLKPIASRNVVMVARAWAYIRQAGGGDMSAAYMELHNALTKLYK